MVQYWQSPLLFESNYLSDLCLQLAPLTISQLKLSLAELLGDAKKYALDLRQTTNCYLFDMSWSPALQKDPPDYLAVGLQLLDVDKSLTDYQFLREFLLAVRKGLYTISLQVQRIFINQQTSAGCFLNYNLHTPRVILDFDFRFAICQWFGHQVKLVVAGTVTSLLYLLILTQEEEMPLQ